MTPTSPLQPEVYSRGWKVFLAIVLAASVTGYFAGLRQSPQRVHQAGEQHQRQTKTTPTRALSEHPPQALSYNEMSRKRLGPNRDFRPSLESLELLPVASPPPPAKESPPELPKSDEALHAALAQRAERRAFEGAPPTIPHPITQIGDESCLVCHGQGVKIGDQIVSKMSHQLIANCTQCHVESVSSEGGEAAASEMFDSTFLGLKPRLRGERAFPGAPPTIPHTTWMRSDCLSCHGPAGRSPIQTAHPWRQSCTQCHAPSTEFDQRPYLENLNPSLP